MLLSFWLRLGIVGLPAYCALAPGVGFAMLLGQSSPTLLGILLALTANAGIVSADFAAFSSHGPSRWYARAAAILVHALLSLGTLAGAGAG
jgi:arginase family enzyme